MPKHRVFKTHNAQEVSEAAAALAEEEEAGLVVGVVEALAEAEADVVKHGH